VIGEGFTRRKIKALLAYLYLRRGQYISKGELLETLWPDVQDAASASGRLKQTILVLRHTLEGRKPERSGWHYILERGGSYYFNTRAPYYSDLEDFEQELEVASADQEPNDIGPALAHYGRAFALYHADLLEDFRYEDWAAARATAVREHYLQALEEAGRLYASRGEYGSAVQLLRRAVREEPLRESGSIQLMDWLWHRGDHAEAMRVYLRLKALLASSLQLEPKPEATALYEAIRRDRAVGGTTPPGGLSAVS
jgi:DNA-binding SARP family transcriptional activator